MLSILNFMLIMMALISAYAHAHEGAVAVEVTETVLTEQQKEAEVLQDRSRRSARNFTAYENIFGDVKLGDPVDKLGKGRVCTSLFIKDGAYGGELVTCTLKKDYGKIEEMPVYDVEYLFHKIEDKHLLTVARILLYRSESYFREQYYGTASTTTEKAGTVISPAKSNYAIGMRCKNISTALAGAWGGVDTVYPKPEWIDGNHQVKATLEGVACNVLKMEHLGIINTSTE